MHWNEIGLLANKLLWTLQSSISGVANYVFEKESLPDLLNKLSNWSTGMNIFSVNLLICYCLVVKFNHNYFKACKAMRDKVIHIISSYEFLLTKEEKLFY